MRREENQDSFGVIRREHFQAFFVCDGMGGAQGGAIASRMTVALLQEMLNQYEGPISQALITATIQTVNRRIFERGRAEPAYAGMGTTLVGLVFTANTLLAVNVGDSRAYRIRSSEIVQISEDHTLVRELVESGAIAPEEAASHPVSHLLTRSLGPMESVEVTCTALSEPPVAGDLFVLCSDGLYNYVSPEDILAVVTQNPIDDASQILINLANQRGGGDNITVLVLAVGEKPRRGRVNSIPLASDSAPEDVAQHTGAEPIAPQTEVINEPPVLPPTVKEPVRRRAFRKAPFAEPRSLTAGPRLIPTTIILGSTLMVGVVLGNFVRSVKDMSVERLYSRVSGDFKGPEVEEQAAPDGSNPLATLAKQIRSERQDPSTTRGESGEAFSRDAEQVRRSVARLQNQIKLLDTTSPLEPTLVSNVRATVAQLEQEYDRLETNLDVASRSVTLWLGRQVAFGGEDISFDSLSDLERLGAFSGQVKQKIAEITSLAYEFRAKADAFELHPENATLRAEVERLRTAREQLKRTLAGDIEKVINSELAASFKNYEGLKTQRDKLWQELQAAKLELETFEALLEPSTQRRLELKRDREARLASEQQLLGEMRTRSPSNNQP
jgi:serine/threonine protein phosphatase PrpC